MFYETNPHICKFKNFEFYLIDKKPISVSQSSYLLSKIIPLLKNLEVLDLGCGAGYFSIGAIYLGAKKVTAVDIVDMKRILSKNIKINHLPASKISFIKSDLFSNLSNGTKFDVIIANLPQHALPASPLAKKLKEKYGGYDGTDLVCRGLAEGAYFLRPKGRYFGAISELTNFQRTLTIAKSLYKIKVRKRVIKKLRENEMTPYVSDLELIKHLSKLKKERLIKYTGDGFKTPLKYIVYLCEFILKK